MKNFVCALLLFCTAAASAQDNKPADATKGVVYGTLATDSATAISADQLVQQAAAAPYTGRVTGKVTSVCQAMGCWFTLQKSDGTTLMVKNKDHAFLLPQNLVGKTVLVDGTAQVKETTEAQRRHLAEDAGKPAAEIQKIKGAQKEVQLIADGVQVLN